MIGSDGRSIVDDDFNPIATDLDRSRQITVDEHEVAPMVRPASNRIGDGLDGANEVRTVPESDLDEVVVVGMIGSVRTFASQHNKPRALAPMENPENLSSEASRPAHVARPATPNTDGSRTTRSSKDGRPKSLFLNRA